MKPPEELSSNGQSAGTAAPASANSRALNASLMSITCVSFACMIFPFNLVATIVGMQGLTLVASTYITWWVSVLASKYIVVRTRRTVSPARKTVATLAIGAFIVGPFAWRVILSGFDYTVRDQLILSGLCFILTSSVYGAVYARLRNPQKA